MKERKINKPIRPMYKITGRVTGAQMDGFVLTAIQRSYAVPLMQCIDLAKRGLIFNASVIEQGGDSSALPCVSVKFKEQHTETGGEHVGSVARKNPVVFKAVSLGEAAAV